MKRKQAWELLYDLASFTRQSFEAAKSLRSYRFVDTEVYAIIRLSNALEQPSQSRVRRLLRGPDIATWYGHGGPLPYLLCFLSFQHSLSDGSTWSSNSTSGCCHHFMFPDQL